MKIALVSHLFAPISGGGRSTYLFNLINGLNQIGDKTIKICLKLQDEPSSSVIKGIKILKFPQKPLNKNLLNAYNHFNNIIYKGCHNIALNEKNFLNNGYNEYCKINFQLSKYLNELVQKHKIDIVHIHDFQLLLAYKYIKKVPLVLTWHIPFSDSIPNLLKQFIISHMKEYNKVIFSCKVYAKSAVKSGLSKNKFEIIYPITNTDLFKPKKYGNKLKRLYKIPKDYKILLCVQRIDAKSGHEQLIKALPRIIKEFPKVNLMFVGGVPLENKLLQDSIYIKKIKKLIRSLNLKQHIIFTGPIKHEKLPMYYNSSDIVALTSRNEGFGLAITEAMACGKPIIGTNVPGIAQQVQNGVNGFLVEVNDFETTAEKILSLLSNTKLRIRMGRESIQLVKTNFQISKGINKHHKLYKRLIQLKCKNGNN